MQNLKPLLRHLEVQIDDTGEIAARTIQARDEAELDRVVPT